MLIAAAGLAGVGKTTALKYLADLLAGSYVYVGGLVRDEVCSRGLALSPENEKVVRAALREEGGMAVLAERVTPRLRMLAEKGPVLLDAIYNVEERDLYQDAFGDRFGVISLAAPAETRASRLASRSERPITPEQLRERDAFERERLGIERVLVEANYAIDNAGCLNALHASLRLLNDQLRP